MKSEGCWRNCRERHLVIFAGEHLDAHDGEYEPEDEAHHKNVEDARDGFDESVDHHLKQEGAAYWPPWHNQPMQSKN